MVDKGDIKFHSHKDDGYVPRLLAYISPVCGFMIRSADL